MRFFFGLILVSVLIPVRLLTHFRWHLIGFACLGAAMTVMVYVQVNPYDRMKHKSDFYQKVYENQISETAGNPGSGTAPFALPEAGTEYLYAACAGPFPFPPWCCPGSAGP